MGIKINQEATILNGKLKGFNGNVVGADWEYNLVQIRVDKRCVVETDYDNIEQEDESISCKNCKYHYIKTDICIDCEDLCYWSMK